MSPPTVQEFEPKADQVRAARRFATLVASQWGIEPGVVESVVGELAANAVLHARSRFTVSLCDHGDRVVIEVADGNPREPSIALVPVGALSGRGLIIVERLSRSWGVRVDPDNGKVVWAEIDSGRAKHRDRPWAK